MENSVSPSLKILLEEEEDKKEKSSDFGDEELFSDEANNSDKKGGEEGEEGEVVNDSSTEAEGAKDEKIEKLADSLKDVVDYMKDVTDTADLFQVQDFLNNDIAAKSQEANDDVEISSITAMQLERKYNLNYKNKISYFLNEKADVEEIEKDIEAVDNIIDKGTQLIDKFKKGTKLNISQYVESSINAYRNFDNLFSKESIVKQAAMNLIILNSGARAEENIREYEELFHEELHKQFGIEYEEHAIITQPHYVATGAVKQG